MFIKKRNSYSFYNPGNSRRLKARKIVKYLLLFLIFYEIITSFFITTLTPETDGMIPSFEKKDFLIVLPVYYSHKVFKYIRIPGIREPERGDIVIYTPLSVKKLPWYLGIPESLYKMITLQKKSITDHTVFQNSIAVKRIVALPGDTVSVKNNIIYIRKSGSSHFQSEFELSNCEYNITFSKQPENWDTKQNPFSGIFDDIILGPDEYFLIGDNRDLTSDSRNTSPVKRNKIRGKIVFRYWPLKRIHVF